mmetsp:Transcript_35584/g.68231  ORF Transcript_35584/g.68231 Transcript_35584/m.68231 type:complete len:125 (-) Transcript_35584:556-930(-)
MAYTPVRTISNPTVGPPLQADAALQISLERRRELDSRRRRSNVHQPLRRGVEQGAIEIGKGAAARELGRETKSQKQHFSELRRTTTSAVSPRSRIRNPFPSGAPRPASPAVQPRPGANFRSSNL